MTHPHVNGPRRWRRAMVPGVAGALLSGILTTLAPSSVGAEPSGRQATGAIGAPTGFAAVPGWGQDSTTGGAGGETVSVSTADAFLDAIAYEGPLIIEVDGTITLPGPMHNVSSDKTIVGLGADSGFSGGGLNIGLPANDAITEPPANAVHNVIIQNLTFDDWADDAVNVQMFSHHVWIDHNTFVSGYDGAADVKRGSSYVTVSWNHSTHGKNMLLGASADHGPQDAGRLNATYHHNFFDGTVERNPWARFGNPVHVYNNYYLNVTKYGVRSSSDAGILAEGNYLQNVAVPFQLSGGGGTAGNLEARENCFADSGQPQTGGRVAAIPYDYQLLPCQEIPTAVPAGAGAGHL